MLFRDRLILWGATGLGVGTIPVAPGTFGSLAGLLLAWSFSGIKGGLSALLILAFCGFAIWIAHEAERIMGGKDPGAIVIDEMAGMLIACAGLSLTAVAAISLFVLFRAFDVLKPFPVGWLDRRLSGGIGIVADDLVAGLLANVVYRAGRWLISAV